MFVPRDLVGVEGAAGVRLIAPTQIDAIHDFWSVVMAGFYLFFPQGSTSRIFLRWSVWQVSSFPQYSCSFFLRGYNGLAISAGLIFRCWEIQNRFSGAPGVLLFQFRNRRGPPIAGLVGNFPGFWVPPRRSTGRYRGEGVSSGIYLSHWARQNYAGATSTLFYFGYVIKIHGPPRFHQLMRSK